MTTVQVNDETVELTEAEAAEWQELIDMHVDPLRALQIVTGNFQDIDPPITPEAQP